MERKHYLDNIRWITVVLVVIYHVIYIFNSQGVLSNFGVQGIRQLDDFLFLVYPWFMVLLFVVSGASSRYALTKKTTKEFMKDRVRRLLVPSIGVIFILGWIMGSITNYYSDIFGGNGSQIPGVIRYVIFCLCGIGPMWFVHELLLAYLVLLLVRKIDKKKILERLGENIKWWGFIILGLGLFLSSLVLNTPVIEVYRNGIYVYAFLVGYYVFSTDNAIELLRQAKKILVPIAVVSAVAYTCYIHFVISPQSTSDVLTSVNYCSLVVLKHPFTNVYAWIMILTVFSVAKDWLDFNNKLSVYMTKANFGFYALHYPILATVAFLNLEILHLPMLICYPINLLGTFILVPICYEIIKRIPVLRTLLLGISI